MYQKMARTITVVASIFGILVAFCSVSSCAKRGYGGALNAMAPHPLNTAVSLITGSPYDDQKEPHISLKIVPSKRIHLTPSEMNSLLFTIKQEIHRKVCKRHHVCVMCTAGQPTGRYSSHIGYINKLHQRTY